MHILSPLGSRWNVRSRTCISTGIGSVRSARCSSLWPPFRTPACSDVAGYRSTGPRFSSGTFGYAVPSAPRWRTWSRRLRTRWSWRWVAHRGTPEERVKTKRLGRRPILHTATKTTSSMNENSELPIADWRTSSRTSLTVTSTSIGPVYVLDISIYSFIYNFRNLQSWIFPFTGWLGIIGTPPLCSSGGVFSFSFILTVKIPKG